MEITEKKKITDKKDGGVRKRVILYYPEAVDGGKAGRRINRFISDIISTLKKDAERASFVYVRCGYEKHNESPLSFLFELELYGKDGVYRHAPFSVTFGEDGRALPLCKSKKEIKEIKRRFKERGINISSRALKYSYYIKDGKTVCYAAPENDRRAKNQLITVS